MRQFTADDVNRIPMTVAIELMREAFQLLSEGKVRVPLRTAVETEDQSGMALFMPSYAPEWKLFGLKVVSVFRANAPPMPSIQGQMLVMDAANGSILAMLDAPAVTALRTGAASGLASDLLSRRESSTLAIFGTGVQARSQVAGVLAARTIRKILVKGKSKENEWTFCDWVSTAHHVKCEPLGNLVNLGEADIICTATTSMEPLISLKHLRPGVHINAIGSYKPTMRELSEDILTSCTLVVDQREAALHEAGEVVIPIGEGKMSPQYIHAELGEIVAGKKAGRTSAKEVTVFKSVGNAIQDLAVARHLVA